MISFKRIMAVSLMVLISNVYANLVLAQVDGPSVFWKFSLNCFLIDVHYEVNVSNCKLKKFFIE